jgi:hypothetical protein
VTSKVSYRLVDRLELVEETVSWNNGALGNECRAIDVVGVLLEKAVPVLWKGVSKPERIGKNKHTIEVATFIDVSVNESITLMENLLF